MSKAAGMPASGVPLPAASADQRAGLECATIFMVVAACVVISLTADACMPADHCEGQAAHPAGCQETGCPPALHHWSSGSRQCELACTVLSAGRGALSMPHTSSQLCIPSKAELQWQCVALSIRDVGITGPLKRGTVSSTAGLRLYAILLLPVLGLQKHLCQSSRSCPHRRCLQPKQ